jgi:hypothetical protein
MTSRWSCLDAAECALFVSDTLKDSGLVESWLYPDSTGRVLTRCEPCNARNPNPRRCVGWEMSLRDHPLLFLPRELEATTVQIECDGIFDFRRQRFGSPTEWEATPFGQCSASVTIRSLASDDAVGRMHLDLANTGQYGPVWHVQVGGARGSLKTPYYREAEGFRWPAAPLDFLLLVELVLFNFYWSTWRAISETATWQEWITRSEDLSLTHYWDHIKTYRHARSRYASWLAAQCNLTSGWDPRPSRI